MKPINPEIFRAYDIRGVVDVDFDEDWVELLGKACGTFFKRRGHSVAVVGRDARLSSPSYAERMVAGLNSCGVDAIVIGMVPSPTFYFAVKTLGKKAGVMITASHNPAEYNGFKIWEGETTIHSEDIQEILEIMQSGNFETGAGVSGEHDILPAYLDAVSAGPKLERPVKVVVDGGNGTSGLICAEILRRIGAEVVGLCLEPDGTFPNHHPDPVVPKYMTGLIEAVKAEKAEAGIGLDGDGDRLGVVDETGTLLFGDQLLAIYARDMLTDFPGATVIGEVKCTYRLYNDIAAHGGQPLMWKTGHSLIKAKMKETGAKLAGEMSGHMFFADRYHGFDDGTYAAMRIVRILAKNPGKPISTYLSDWPTTVSTPEIRMDCPDAIKFQVVEKAQAYFRERYEIIDVDGARVSFPDGWGLVRASNTQPVLVLRFEAETQARMDEIRAAIEGPLQEIIKSFG